MTRKTRRTVQIALWLLVALAAIGVLWTRLGPKEAQFSPLDVIGRGDYHLSTTEGTEFSEASLKGQPSAVFFGFTHCPEVCPTTLGDIATWQQDLGSDGPLKVFFITVDPERDSVDQLRDYVSWVPGVQGVSGTQAEIDKAIRAFRIYARKVPLEDGDYTMDHSANVLLFDAKGKFFEPIGYQEDFDRVAEKLKRLVKG